MAIRVKRSGYEVYYRDPVTGKQRSRYFKTRREAEKEERRIKYMLEFDRVKLVEEDADRTPLPPMPEPPQEAYTLSDAAQDWLKWNNTDKLTGLLSIVVKRFGSLDVRTITTQTLSQCVLRLQRDGLTATSVAREMVALMSLLRIAETMGIISELPVKPRLAHGQAEQFIPPSEEELALLYDNASPVLQRVIVLGAYFGMRVGPCELFSVKWSDIDLDNWVIRLRAAKKNHREPVRVLPIPQKFRAMFTQWYEADGKDPDVRIVPYNTPLGYTTWNNLLKKAGITRKIRPYDLRHAFATNALRRGIDIGTVAKLMGHTSTTMVVKYYQYVGDSDKLKALEKIAQCMDSPSIQAE